MRHRKIKQLAQGHTASVWRSQDFNSGSLASIMKQRPSGPTLEWAVGRTREDTGPALVEFMVWVTGRGIRPLNVQISTCEKSMTIPLGFLLEDVLASESTFSR